LTEAEKMFSYIATTYLTAGEMELSELKASIERNPEKPWTSDLKQMLQRFRDGDGKTQGDYATLTDHEFDEPEAYHAWLAALWGYLYKGGADPS